MSRGTAQVIMNDNVKPLFIDAELERSPLFPGHPVVETLNRAARRFLKHLGLVSGAPYGHRSVNTQLAGRRVFPREQWAESGLPLEFVHEVLLLIERHGCWPNHHILPCDRMCLLTSCSAFSLASAGLLFDVSRRFRIERGDASLRKLVQDEGATVAQFVEMVLRARNEMR